MDEVTDLVSALKTAITNEGKTVADNCHLMVAPSFVHLCTVSQAISESKATQANTVKATIKLASQDVSALTECTGAYTGDVSAKQLQDIGAEWVLVGHSERRQYYNEAHTALLSKLNNSADNNLGIVFCIGESEAQFDAGETEQVLAEQLEVVRDYIAEQTLESGKFAQTQQFGSKHTDGADSDTPANIIIAYEPIWAIGTGKVPSVSDVTQVHTFIRQQLVSFHSALAVTPILYGGSVKPDNAAEFAQSDAINGVLVGGAALDAQNFTDIAKAFIT